jgi:hypothetical protein
VSISLLFSWSVVRVEHPLNVSIIQIGMRPVIVFVCGLFSFLFGHYTYCLVLTANVTTSHLTLKICTGASRTVYGSCKNKIGRHKSTPTTKFVPHLLLPVLNKSPNCQIYNIQSLILALANFSDVSRSLENSEKLGCSERVGMTVETATH